MRNPDRIPQVLEGIEHIWRQHPDWRLGQLICNLTAWADPDASSPYDIEDETLLVEIERHVTQNEPVAVD